MFSKQSCLQLAKVIALTENMFFSSETKTILVQNHIAVDRNTGCTLPFSWRIKDCLDELWVHALQREGILLHFFPCYVFFLILFFLMTNQVCYLE